MNNYRTKSVTFCEASLLNEEPISLHLIFAGFIVYRPPNVYSYSDINCYLYLMALFGLKSFIAVLVTGER